MSGVFSAIGDVVALMSNTKLLGNISLWHVLLIIFFISVIGLLVKGTKS